MCNGTLFTAGKITSSGARTRDHLISRPAPNLDLEIWPKPPQGPGPEVIKLFSCSTQFSIKFQMLLSIKISRKSAIVRLS